MEFRQQRIRENLRLRARIIDAVRAFFGERDYLEVETPCRMPAPAPEAHIDAVAADGWFLQTSPELPMKRLLAAGYARIFQICKCFRAGERGNRHLPELTMLEWYTAASDYRDMMRQCESMIPWVAAALGRGGVIGYQGKRIDLAPPWPRISVAEAFRQFGGLSWEAALAADRFDEVMGLDIEPALGWERPVFLCDYPAELAALSRLKAADPRFAERFELYVGGVELCNAFSELTDSHQQRCRFEAERQRRAAAGKTVYPMPGAFLDALPAMPPAAGNALGIDRLVMLFADTARIDDVVAFTPEEL